jgi:hypothetical protein
MSMWGGYTLDQVLIQTLDHCLEQFSSVDNHPDYRGDRGDPKAGLIPLPDNPFNAKQTTRTRAYPKNSIAVRVCMTFFLM